MGLSERYRRLRLSAELKTRYASVIYALLWIAGAGAVAAIAIVLLRTEGDDTVTLPPVHQFELSRAARKAGCELRRRDGTTLNPPVTGAVGGRPAGPGVYEDPVPVASLIAAMRRGVIVIQYRAGLRGADVRQLEELQKAVPTGTILAPNATRMPYEIAVTAYRRLLGCRTFTAAAIDAVRLFRGRFVGSGPDV